MSTTITISKAQVEKDREARRMALMHIAFLHIQDRGHVKVHIDKQERFTFVDKAEAYRFYEVLTDLNLGCMIEWLDV